MEVPVMLPATVGGTTVMVFELGVALLQPVELV
jgi:hypothetical protein